MKQLPLPAALLALALLPHCKKADPDPLSQLPPETQTGANTFGCLVNGQVYTPKGNNGFSNYTVYYDPAYRKGTLNVATYRYIGEGSSQFQTLGFYSDSISSVGTYSLTFPGHQEATFSDYTTKCEFHSNELHYRTGYLKITRLDRGAGIVSGTFEFTLAKAGCDTIRVTQGRFDKKM